MPNNDPGPIYTSGTSFRARAEARQRKYRAEVLRHGYEKWGHFLDDTGVAAGANFVSTAAHEKAKARDTVGKGVGDRTFRNMLASQAMCFNVFAPLKRARVDTVS